MNTINPHPCKGCAKIVSDHRPSKQRIFCSIKCKSDYDTRMGLRSSKFGAGHPQNFTPEWKARISAAKMGHQVTEETKAKISATEKGIRNSPETEFKKGVRSTPQHEFTSEKLRKMWEDPAFREARMKDLAKRQKHQGPTSIEQKLINAFRELHLKFEVELPALNASVIDIAFPDKKVAVFADGCFYHLCPKHYPEPPKGWEVLKRVPFKDNWQNEVLKREGWFVFRLWEHEIKDPEIFEEIVKVVLQVLKMERKSIP